MKEYVATIGLEIHAQLKTKTKLFSASINDPEVEKPNSIVSPIDAGHPGTLPALNYQAVKNVITLGLAIGAKVANYTEWDRKNYFYPDIPKAYQISQYKYPLVTGGEIAGVSLTRIHLEEDTGRSIHDQGDFSLVDLNRAGMPLMELVTDPVIHSSAQASKFAKELQLLLRYLDIGEANLEKGEMRIEANISVSNTDQLGTKVEVKNLNSFKSVERAIDYEIDRHIKALNNGESIIQETRGWDEVRQVTFSQRAKEDAHDYRYFPDPDLPKLYIKEVFDLEAIKANLPELPSERRLLLADLDQQKIDLLIDRPELYNLYQNVLTNSSNLDPIKVANVITAELLGLELEYGSSVTSIDAGVLAEIIQLSHDSVISSSGLKTLLDHYVKNSEKSEPTVVAERLSLVQKSGSDYFAEIIKHLEVVATDAVTQYRGGDDKVLAYLIGQAMKYSNGQVNPQEFTLYLKKHLR